MHLVDVERKPEAPLLFLLCLLQVLRIDCPLFNISAARTHIFHRLRRTSHAVIPPTRKGSSAEPLYHRFPASWTHYCRIHNNPSVLSFYIPIGISNTIYIPYRQLGAWQQIQMAGFRQAG